MEGDALSWYRWSDSRSPFRSWGSLKRKLFERFQESNEGMLYEQFLAITQTGTSRERVMLFEKLAGQLVGISEEVLEGTFIKGLKPDIRSAVRVMQPEGLNHAMKLTISLGGNKNYDMFIRGGGSNRSMGPTSTSSYTRNSGTSSTRTLVSTIPADRKNGSGSLVRPGPFKRLTEAEFTEKRSEGLCFKCDEKFLPGHRCPTKILQVLLVGDDEEFVEEETNGSDTSHVHLDSVEVSLNSVIGFTSPRTMKLCGNIGGIDIVVLIDSGATHNFLSQELVKHLGLFVSRTGSINEDFFPLPLGSTDAILGIKWLETLGDMSVNWKTLTMSFGEEMLGIANVAKWVLEVSAEPSKSKGCVCGKGLIYPACSFGVKVKREGMSERDTQ
ncbi:putative mitochondrial protein [Tanacetum coccineum]|uniref:Mitochondrial protein n=1 Tax=Tanacetum coccineum TaxID=301880 RepID=A0ABQ5H971_9ASTR